MLPRIEVLIIDQQKVPNLTCKQRNLDCSTFARIVRELKIEWEHLFKLFLVNLDEKITSMGYKREQDEKQSQTMRTPIIYSNLSPRGLGARKH